MTLCSKLLESINVITKLLKEIKICNIIYRIRLGNLKTSISMTSAAVDISAFVINVP